MAEKITMNQFIGPSFALYVPSDWIATSDVQHQAIFLGPQIGKMRATITIEMAELKDVKMPFSEIVEDIRTYQQSQYEDYEVLDERDISADLPGIARFYRWYDNELDMVLYQRQFIVFASPYLYIIRATQGNNDEAVLIDSLFQEIFNSIEIHHFAGV